MPRWESDNPVGFDLDEETVELFDAILVNIATDPELREEFKKMQFIKTLQGKATEGKGPIQQLLEKVARLEKNSIENDVDLRRVIADLQHVARQVDKLMPTTGTASAPRPMAGIHDMDPQYKYYLLQRQKEGKQ